MSRSPAPRYRRQFDARTAFRLVLQRDAGLRHLDSTQVAEPDRSRRGGQHQDEAEHVEGENPRREEPGRLPSLLPFRGGAPRAASAAKARSRSCSRGGLRRSSV